MNSSNLNGCIISELFPLTPNRNLRVSVIVPVKNEEIHLTKTLDALRRQTDNAGNPFPFELYEVLLLINNTTDGSLKLAKTYQQKHKYFRLYIANIKLPKDTAHIGTARKLLMDEACKRFQSLNGNGIIASTDGDTEVDKQWLYYIIKEIDNGSDVVGGRIISKPVNKSVHRYYLQDVAYRYLSKKLESQINPCAHDPWPSHFQCYGASMAVRNDIYKQAGGLPALPFLEDAAFCHTLTRMDAKIRCSPMVKVYTSSRRSTRIHVGFSAHLKHLETMQKQNEQQYVEAPEILKIKFINKQRLKHYWTNKNVHAIHPNELSAIAEALCLPAGWLYKQFRKAVFFGELWEETERKMYKTDKWKKINQHILITKAIQQLRAWVN